MHRFEARQCFQPDHTIAHGEVITLYQGKTQIASKVRLLVIGFVVRARGEQYSKWLLAFAQRFYFWVTARLVGRTDSTPIGEAIAHCGKKSAQTLYVKVTKQFGECTGDNQAIFQRITSTRRSLRAVCHYP